MKSRKCSKSYQYQITNCITRSLLHFRSSRLPIIQIILSAKLLEDWCLKHILFSLQIFFQETALIEQIDTSVVRVGTCLHFPPLSCRSSGTLRSGAPDWHKPLLWTPRYHHSMLAEQPLSHLWLLKTRPFTLRACKLPTVNQAEWHPALH